ncbi:MAG: ABC transporter ATP-binding protein [Alphaproteobacteria bacterium]
MTREFLEVEKICVNYDAVQALEDVSLRVGEGEIVTVIGSNGAGKTTLMKTIAGLLQSRSGAISFEGQGISALEAHAVVVRGISLVPEGRQVFGRMSVHENLILGAYSRRDQALGDDLKRSYQLFPRLRERRDQRAGTLSGGEQQMLAIARGLMSRPRLLLMDEPSLGLAPRLVRETFEVVENLRRQGTTILMVEQMARMALKVSDRAYVLEHGRIVQEGASAELLGDARVLSAYLGAKKAGGD